MNELVITGYLGKDPEAFAFGTDGQGAKFSVAVNKAKRDEAPEWFRVACFGQQAKYALEYLRKGAHVAVAGSVELQTWDKKDGGGTGYSLEVNAHRVEGLGKSEGGSQPAPAPAQQRQQKPAPGPDIDWTMDEDEEPFGDQ